MIREILSNEFLAMGTMFFMLLAVLYV